MSFWLGNIVPVSYTHLLIDMKYVLVKIESEDSFDDTVLNNNHLPHVVMNDKITDWTMNIITDGDLTNVLNADSVSYTHLDVYKRQT